MTFDPKQLGKLDEATRDIVEEHDIENMHQFGIYSGEMFGDAFIFLTEDSPWRAPTRSTFEASATPSPG